MEVDPNAQIGLCIDHGKIQLTSVIGCGSFSYVYKGVDVADQRQQFAVKCLWKKGLTMEQLKYQRMEADFLSNLNLKGGHPNVLKLYKIVETPYHLYLVTELCEVDLFDYILLKQQGVQDCTDLQQWHPTRSEAASLMLLGGSGEELRQRLSNKIWSRKRNITQINSSGLSEYEVRSFLGQILGALEHCHKHGVYHRDIKPENILLVKNPYFCQEIHSGYTPETFEPEYIVKLADFGLATTESISKDFRCGSTRYLSPEALGYGANAGYNVPKGDVWSTAVLLINMCYGKNPWTEACLDDATFHSFVMEDPDLLQREFNMPRKLAEALRRVFLFTEDERCSLSEFKQLLSECPSFVADFDEDVNECTNVGVITDEFNNLQVEAQSATAAFAQTDMPKAPEAKKRSMLTAAIANCGKTISLPLSTLNSSRDSSAGSLHWYRRLLQNKPRAGRNTSLSIILSTRAECGPEKSSDETLHNGYGGAVSQDGDNETLFEWEDELGMTPLRAPRYGIQIKQKCLTDSDSTHFHKWLNQSAASVQSTQMFGQSYSSAGTSFDGGSSMAVSPCSFGLRNRLGLTDMEIVLSAQTTSRLMGSNTKLQSRRRCISGGSIASREEFSQSISSITLSPTSSFFHAPTSMDTKQYLTLEPALEYSDSAVRSTSQTATHNGVPPSLSVLVNVASRALHLEREPSSQSCVKVEIAKPTKNPNLMHVFHNSRDRRVLPSASSPLRNAWNPYNNSQAKSKLISPLSMENNKPNSSANNKSQQYLITPLKPVLS